MDAWARARAALPGNLGSLAPLVLNSSLHRLPEESSVGDSVVVAAFGVKSKQDSNVTFCVRSFHHGSAAIPRNEGVGEGKLWDGVLNRGSSRQASLCCQGSQPSPEFDGKAHGWISFQLYGQCTSADMHGTGCRQLEGEQLEGSRDPSYDALEASKHC
eukprot:300436-Rhodomonas_salina.2